ncbi:MAG: glycoside hydrolase [Spirochaetes bacterium]|nr:glycoside hydrolase [Spirochaetota bacterium]
MKPDEFKNPAPTYRPAPFWSWNADLQEDELRAQIRDMKEKGWGGYFMHSRVGLITPYLGKKWHSLIRACAEEAAKTGTQAWLYDEDKWPSGFAGGLVPEKDPSFRMKALLCVPAGSENPETDTPLGETVVDGKTYRLVRHLFPLGDAWFNGASYIDTLNPRAVAEFLRVTIDGYAQEVGDQFGKAIPGIFTDEPCYLMRKAGEGGLPWTDALPDFFRERKGYDLLPALPALFFERGDSAKVRFDFFDCATRLFLESFTKPYHAACKKNRLLFTGHFMAEDNLRYQMQWIGAAMPHYEHMDWPGIDKLARHVDQTVTVKQVASAAEQLGKERTFCEVFGISGQQFDFRGRRWIHHWEAALGVNFVNHHLSLYTMMGERKRDYPPNFFHQQPWWPWEKPLADHFARLNLALTRGKRHLDILMLHPIGSAWASYQPLGEGGPWSGALGRGGNLALFDQAFKTLTDRLLAKRLDFHYGDEIIMEGHAKVDGAVFTIGGHGYRHVIVPPSLTWRTRTVKDLKAFCLAGGDLVFVEPLPSLIDGGEPLDVRAEFPKASVVASPEALIDHLRARKTDCVSVTNLDLGAEADEVFIHSRRLDDGRLLHFLANTSETKTVRARIRLPGAFSADAWDCGNGGQKALPGEVKDGAFVLDHEFTGGDGLLLVEGPQRPATAPAVLTPPSRILPLEAWTGTANDPNVLRVDRVTLTLGAATVLTDAPIHKAWDAHFYKAAEGTPFTAEYTFEVDALPATPVRAVVEMAPHLDQIRLNGVPIEPDGGRYLGDLAFTTLDVSKALKAGTNRLVIGGRKHNNITRSGCHRRVGEAEFPYRNTELEVVYLVGDFGVVNWENRRFAIGTKPARLDFSNVSACGYPFYAGTLRFQCAFELKGRPERALLAFSDVAAACLELRVNGQEAGVKLWAPFEWDITPWLRPGENRLECVFPTDLFNLMGPNPLTLGTPTAIGHGTFREDRVWTPEVLLLRRGIAGARLTTW